MICIMLGGMLTSTRSVSPELEAVLSSVRIFFHTTKWCLLCVEFIDRWLLDKFDYLWLFDCVCRYKPSPTGTVSDDPTPEYMNLLGMIFSMCGLMLKVVISLCFCACVKSRKNVGGTLCFLCEIIITLMGMLLLWMLLFWHRFYGHICFKSFIWFCLQLKWCAWAAIYCAFISFANSRSSEDTKQMLSSFM